MTTQEAMAVVENAAGHELEAMYLASDGSACPVCKSRSITAMSGVEADDDYAWQRIMCMDCHASWEDTYVLTGFINLSIPEESEDDNDLHEVGTDVPHHKGAMQLVWG